MQETGRLRRRIGAETASGRGDAQEARGGSSTRLRIGEWCLPDQTKKTFSFLTEEDLRLGSGLSMCTG